MSEHKSTARRYTDEYTGMTAVGRPLPADSNAERALLGALLANPDAIVEVEPWFDAAWFSQQQYRWMYDAILACGNQTPPLVPDIFTVGSMLRRHHNGEQSRLEAVGGMTYLSELASCVPTLGGAASYAHSIREAAIRRQLIEAGGKIAACGYEEEQALAETLAGAQEMLGSITDRHSQDEVTTIGDVTNAIFEHGQQRQAGGGPDSAVVPTPFYDLNHYLGGGLRRGDLTVVAARPGVGKTSFAQAIALDVAKQGHPVLFFSLEMSNMDIGYRFLSMETGFSAQFLECEDWLDNDAQLKRVLDGMGAISGLPISISDAIEQTVQQVRARARMVQRRAGQFGLVVVDYLQLLRYVTGKKRMDFRVQEVTEVAQALKAMAQELHAPVLALAQLNRAVEGRTNRVPQLSDLRESGAIEQAADQVLMLYREELYDKETDKKGIAEVYIAKNRKGSLGMVPLAFHAETTMFRNLAIGRALEGY